MSGRRERERSYFYQSGEEMGGRKEDRVQSSVAEGKKDVERDKGKEKELKYNRMWGLLEDFPNLKVGGLLPNPEKPKESWWIH